MLDKPWIRHYDPGVPAHLEYPEERVFDFLDRAAQAYPQRACTIFQDQVITYQEMAQLSDRLASGLEQLGLRKGERVAILMPNIPQYLLAYYAILKAGGVVAALNPNYKAREVRHQLNDSGVALLFALAGSAQLVAEAREGTGLRRVVWMQLEDAAAMPSWLLGGERAVQPGALLAEADVWAEDLVRAGGEPRAKARVRADDPAIFQYSGGTTGTPKAAIGLHRNLTANTRQFRRWLGGLEAGQETVLLAIPLYHVYGMVVGMSVGVMLGARLVLVPDPRDLVGLLAKVQTYRASFYPGVPAMYAAINQHPDVLAGKYDLRSIRACISGSAPLLEEVRLRFERLTGAKLMEGYGLSEAPTATHCNPMLGEKRAGSIGLPLPDVDCRIVSLEDGRTNVAAGAAGELLIRSPQVMQGYHDMPEETAEALRDGWLHTGDIVRMDADGYFYIIDRKKDLIKVSGFQVWPREVEEIIAAHPGVREVAAAGIPDTVRGEAVKVWVVKAPGASVSAEELIALCSEALVYYKAPVEVEFREQLPRSGVGKLLRRELVREHIERGG